MPTFAVWEMRDAFESEWVGTDEGQGQAHQYHVMAAAQSILWDGQEIFKYMSNPLPISDVDAQM